MVGTGPNEADTCREFVLPMLSRAGWTEDQIRPEYPVAAGRFLSGAGVERELGRGRVDYVLEARPGVPVAVIEAKREYEAPTQGVQQAVRYAQQLRVPRAYASNGDGIVERDMATGQEHPVGAVPPPSELWATYVDFHGLDDSGAQLVGQPFNRNNRTAAGEVVTPPLVPDRGRAAGACCHGPW